MTPCSEGRAPDASCLCHCIVLLAMTSDASSLWPHEKSVASAHQKMQRVQVWKAFRMTLRSHRESQAVSFPHSIGNISAKLLMGYRYERENLPSCIAWQALHGPGPCCGGGALHARE
jgi:hypothetical protein